MSYILEALNKAEAERRAGTAQPEHLPPSLITHSAGPISTRLWLWLTAPVAIAAAGTGLWIATAPAGSEEKVAVRAEAPPHSPPKQTEKPPEKLAEKPTEKPAQKPVAKPSSKPAERALEKKRAPEREQSKTAKAPPQEPPLGPLRDLPEHIQREIPILAIGGYIYSGNKADRSVLINNRLLRDGDEIAPGLTLEKMLPSGMILSYKGYRYRSSY